MERKPADKIIAIDSVRYDPEPQPPVPVSLSPFKKSNPEYVSRRRQALRLFFLMGSGVWKVHRVMGVPTQAIEEDLRELGWAEWERRNGRKAA